MKDVEWEKDLSRRFPRFGELYAQAGRKKTNHWMQGSRGTGREETLAEED